LSGILAGSFGHSGFRRHQEAVCRAVIAGDDVLLVMPTGAGKSLCYQLPGIALKGTTLVISPLIALMEDQVAALQDRGLAAERIHSGRPRTDSRRVCELYKAGKLDFLFIAPERLGVPGFPEFLASHKPVLIAVDEAHCISQWGHDFRPDYRMLKARLPRLRPAPVIAMTATATPLVQRDIATQLGMENAGRFIHGFRRENIGIELVEMLPSQRPATIERILSKEENRPALVYAPTRKLASSLAEELSASIPAAAYHAGMKPEARDQVQAAFLGGELDVIVATIAFGMGIDKPDIRTVIHTALSGSVENYYQEIGRGGRDGLPARAVLLHGYSDLRTHQFFLDRDYPPEAVLRTLFQVLDERPRFREAIFEAAGLEPELFEKGLEKLRIHGGAILDREDQVTRGEGGWERPYAAQRRHREEQMALIARFAGSRGCRMIHLVRHFGDQDDSGRPCGLCDFCSPESCVALNLRPADRDERIALEQILDEIRANNGSAAGRLHRDLFGKRFSRNRFEQLLTALARAGLVEIGEDSFEKDGRVIEFRRVFLTPAGRDVKDVEGIRIEAQAAAPRRKKRSSRKK
jgi:DNA topoisomerase-3